MIQECQRISKRKNFTVSKILDKSPAHLAEIELNQQKQEEIQDNNRADGNTS